MKRVAIVASVIAVFSFLEVSRCAELTAPRQGLFIGNGNSEAACARLREALSLPHSFHLTQYAPGIELRTFMRKWKNEVRNLEADWTLLYVQADGLDQQNGEWRLVTTFGDLGKPISLPLKDALNFLSQASKTAPGLVVLSVPKTGISKASLTTALKNAGPEGSVTVIVVKSDPAARALSRLLGGGELSSSTKPTPFTTGDLVRILEERFASEVVAVSHGASVKKHVLATHRPRTLDEMITTIGEEIGDRLPPSTFIVAPDATSDLDSAPLLRRVASARLRATLAAAFHRVLANEEIVRTASALEAVRQADPGELAKQCVRFDANPVILQMRLTSGDDASQIRVRCDVLQPLQSKTKAFSLEGLAMLTPMEWCLKGQSVVTKGGNDSVKLPRKVSTAPALATIDFSQPANVERVLEETRELEARTRQESHPLTDGQFPLRVELFTQDKPATKRFSADQKRQYVALNKDQRYTIRVSNSSGKPVFLRLLVDGLNTLPDRPLTDTRREGAAVLETAVKDPNQAFTAAPYALLHNARSWFCEQGEYEVRGFFTQIANQREGSFSTLAKGDRAEFVVTDAKLSEAEQQGHSKDVGIVTAAFFSAVDDPIVKKSLGPKYGTKLGKIGSENVELYSQNLVPGELLAVIHVHYGFE